jgi:hypothetical protein
VILRCTKKLLSVIGPVPISETTPDAEDWYANLLWFDRRKCLLLTHVGTLFTILEADINGNSLVRACRPIRLAPAWRRSSMP